MRDQDIAEGTATTIATLEARLAQVTAERDAIQAKVEKLQRQQELRKEQSKQRDLEREERVRQRLAEIAAIEEAQRFVMPQPPILIEASRGVSTAARTQALTDPADLYLDLLKNCLTRLATGENPSYDPYAGEYIDLHAQRRIEGSDWPAQAETMAGLLRLDNVQHCVVDALRNQIPGDLVETGVWRGGITILMRGILRAFGDTGRTVWAADSFAGLPVPDAERYAADAGHDLSTSAGYDYLAIPVEEVRANFDRYGLLDDQVRLLVGWFRDTLPGAPIERISVLRLDGDLYESTMDALNALYPKLSIGGYLIVDDYLSWEPCRLAVDEYRATHGITEPIHGIDWSGAYWQRER